MKSAYTIGQGIITALMIDRLWQSGSFGNDPNGLNPAFFFASGFAAAWSLQFLTKLASGPSFHFPKYGKIVRPEHIPMLPVGRKLAVLFGASITQNANDPENAG
jgi:hypothetical protein